MRESTLQASDPHFAARAVDAAIRIGIVFLLAFWCFSITKPFLIPTVWGVIIAVGVYPLFVRIRDMLGNRPKTAAVVFTVASLALLLTPMVLLAESAVDEAKILASAMQEGTVQVPAPPDNVAEWPLIGEPLHRFWALASDNLEEALREAAPQIRQFGAVVLSTAASLGALGLQFIVSILIAGVLLANPKRGTRAANVISTRLAGARGEALVGVAAATVRSVFQGVLGVAIIQAIAAGLGMLAADVPAAGLWAIGVLIVAIVQLPPLLILLPVSLYVFSTSSTTTAVVFLVWSVLVSFSDTFLKPMFLGRGVDVPMLVILLGAIGGMILHGIIGLFVGATVLALSYELCRQWIASSEQPATTES